MSPTPSSDGPANGFLPSGWNELAPLLDAVLDAPAGSRERVLDDVSAGDPVRRAALAQLLADCERTMPLLDTPAAEGFPRVADAMPALPALLGDRYRTGREVGRGGMAHVYLAHDVKHGRDVAVKVIRRELAESLGRERFLREIAIAARLRHPNIVPLFDSGDADGVLYFVMPFEDGPSVRTRLAADGPFPIAEAVSVLRDVARALQYAHAQGVVHRDIKPDNVILSGGAAVVADFGIAKAVSAARAEAVGGTITQVGTSVGTPAYMAPEQAVGDPNSDHRADIYSFGCLAYEVLAGVPPFQNMSTPQLVAAHVGTVPQPITDRRAGVPASLAQLVTRCLEKEPADRPQDAGALIAALDGRTSASYRVVRAPRRALWVAGAVALGVLSMVLYAILRQPSPAAGISLAVLPFGNIGSDSAMTPLGTGLGDEVFTVLQRVPGLQMRSRTGARAYIGKLGVDEIAVGRALGVDYLLGGDLREDGGRWRITARLTKTSDATELWNDTFSVDPQQQLSVAEDIANGATLALRNKFPKVLGQARVLRPNQTTTNAEAHRLYVLGQELLSRRGMGGVKESAERFRDAIRLDSTYAGAYAGLSMALALFPLFQPVTADDVACELTASAERALRLDSTLAQPHVALGLANEHRYRWDLAGTEFREAIRLEPSDVEAHVQYGRYLLFMLRTKEGLAQLQIARRADPASPVVLGWTAYAFFLAGRRDSARVISSQSLQGNVLSGPALSLAAIVLLADGLRDSARALARHLGPQGVPYILAATGDSTLAREQIEAARDESPHSGKKFANAAWFALGIRDTASALSALERATASREIWPEYYPISDPMFDALRASPRFLALLKGVGLQVPSPAAIASRGSHAA